LKANQKVLDINFDSKLHDAVMMPSNWDELGIWEPILRTIANVTDYLQADTTPISGVHALFLYFERSLVSPNLSSIDQT
jgi:hypothetical protein